MWHKLLLKIIIKFFGNPFCDIHCKKYFSANLACLWVILKLWIIFKRTFQCHFGKNYKALNTKINISDFQCMKGIKMMSSFLKSYNSFFQPHLVLLIPSCSWINFPHPSPFQWIWIISFRGIFLASWPTKLSISVCNPQHSKILSPFFKCYHCEVICFPFPLP